MPNGATGDHEPRVQSTTGDSSQRVPSSVVEPIEELVEAVCDEVFGGSEVEPWVEFMDDTLEPDDGEQTGRDRCAGNAQQDDSLEHEPDAVQRGL